MNIDIDKYFVPELSMRGKFFLIVLVLVGSIITMGGNAMREASFLFFLLIVLVLSFLLLLALYFSDWGKEIEKRDNIKKQMKQQLIVKEAQSIIDRHFDTLYTKFIQLRYRDEYGYWHEDKWNKELKYFIDNVFSNEFSVEGKTSMVLYKKFVADYFNQEAKKEIESGIISTVKKEVHTGEDFEDFIKEILQNKGLDIQKTPKTGDQGVDLIVKTDTDKIAIQCKFYSRPVGNKAVQEIAAGKVFYRCNKAIVVSNQSYTVSARKLAQNLGVELLNEKTLLSYFN